MSDPRTDVHLDPATDDAATPADEAEVADVEVLADPDLTTGEPVGDRSPEADPTEASPGVALAERAASDPRSREELLAELEEAEARRDEYLDDLRRARAEFENYRRRTVRESAGAREAGRAEILTALLEVLDDLDRTLAASEDSSDASLRSGVRLVAEKLVRTMQAQGLSRLDEVGVPFDPEIHEAVQQVDADGPVEAPTVQQVLRPGYRLGEKVLRPAMVTVAS